jgi:hypothetical protein
MGAASISCGGRAQARIQEIDFYLNAVGPVRMIREIEVPLPQRVVVDPILKRVPETGKDLLDRFGYFGAVAERCFAVNVPDVVEIDIDGKTREIEIEEIEGRSALEGKLSSEVSTQQPPPRIKARVPEFPPKGPLPVVPTFSIRSLKIT